MDSTYSHTLAFIQHKQARRHKKLVRAPTLIHATGSHVATVTYQHVHTPKTSTPIATSLCELKNSDFSPDSQATNIQSSKESFRSSSRSTFRPVIPHTKRKLTTMVSLPRTASKDKSPEMLPSSPKKISSDTVLLRRWIKKNSQSMSQITDKVTNWFDLSWTSMDHTECEPFALMFEDLVPLLCTVDSSLFLKTFQIMPGISIGILILPPYEKKSAANTRDNSLVFFVIQGLVTITVNGHSFTAKKASHFMVLQDSIYQFASESDSDTVMYFVHVMH